MPYIVEPSREDINPTLDPLIEKLLIRAREWPEYRAGDLNYAISRIIWAVWADGNRYRDANELVGVLECAKQEFLRRHVGPYEDGAIKRNGDF